MDDERRSAARVTLEVGGDLWERVSTLESSRPDDRHYTAQEDDQGRTTVTFGDGEHGAPLPAGAHIITATYEPGARYDRVILQVGRVATDADWPADTSASGVCCGVYRGRVIDAADPLAQGATAGSDLRDCGQRFRLGAPLHTRRAAGGPGCRTVRLGPLRARRSLPPGLDRRAVDLGGQSGSPLCEDSQPRMARCPGTDPAKKPIPARSCLSGRRSRAGRRADAGSGFQQAGLF